MQVVIDIPEEFYKHSCETGFLCWELMTLLELTNAIKNGTPLPEHHGRIIDESKIRSFQYVDGFHYGTGQDKCMKIPFIEIVGTDAPTIIERSERE